MTIYHGIPWYRNGADDHCPFIIEGWWLFFYPLSYLTLTLYKAFPAAEAHRIARKLEIHYTPKHGSWLDIAEIELNVMTRQCLTRRIADVTLLRQELAAWESDRNGHTACIQWKFTTENARTKLVSLYPKFGPIEEN